MKTFTVALTGASGSTYAVHLLKELAKQPYTVHVVCSAAGAAVLEHETGYTPDSLLSSFSALQETHGSRFHLHAHDDLFAPIASGSCKIDAMVVVPCSMHSLCGIAAGTLPGLIGRAADVTLKEQRKLVVVPRETPLSSIHLRAMLQLSDLGVTVLPAMPGFYHHPDSLDDIIRFMSGRVLQALDIETNLLIPWSKTE